MEQTIPLSDSSPMQREYNTNTNLSNTVRTTFCRKKLKQMLFVYMALMHGWQVRMVNGKSFQFSRPHV